MRTLFVIMSMLAITALGQGQPPTRAVAVVQPTQGNIATGVVRFEQMGESTVKVSVDLKGLPPSRAIGFHIHEFGDLSAPDATSAGGHYNPEGHPHAGPDVQQRHAGDLGNLQTDAQGNARKEITAEGVTIAGPRNPIVGRAIIVHEKADDLKTQPTGDAGGRIGGGVIGLASTQPAK